MQRSILVFLAFPIVWVLFLSTCYSFIINKRAMFRFRPVSVRAMYKFGYGPSDWLKLRRDSEFVVDKTHAIAMLERLGCYLRFWRPTRFGKSLFCSQLRLYYDINTSDEKVSKLQYRFYYWFTYSYA